MDEQRYREHRREALLVDAPYPLEARIGAHVARRRGDARVRDPAGDPYADAERGFADERAIQSVRRDEPEHAVAALQQIQR